MNDYYTEENLSKLINDLQEEIIRVKEFINSNHYNNGTTINHIVRMYRNNLKEYLEIVKADYTYKRKG